MRYFPLLCATLLMTACGSSDDDASGGGSPVGGCPASGDGPDALECQVLELVNQQRALGTTCNGTPMPPVAPLSMHPTLHQTARNHALDMADNGYFAHENLAGKNSAQRMSDAGYDWSAAGENIAGGKADPGATMQQRLTSTSGHCENIMSAKFVHIGVGYAYAESHDLRHLWVQNFGAPAK